MVKNKFLKFAMMTLVLGLLGSCGTDELPPVAPEAATQMEMIGGSFVIPSVGSVIAEQGQMISTSNGGTLTLSSSRLVVPAGALSRDTVITWTIVGDRPGGLNSPLERVHRFQPHGIQFQSSATAYISFEDAALGTNNPNDYDLYYHNEETGVWEIQDTQVDVRNGQFIVRLDHFSRYAFGR